MKLIERIRTLRPLRVLSDRSRDSSSPANLLWLEPHGTIKVTDNHGRLTAALLKQFDMLAICGHGVKPYSVSELKAIEEFVHRGGSLVLAASAMEFAHFAERPVGDLAINAVARLFGFEFLEGEELPLDSASLQVMRPARLVETAAGKRLGLPINDTPFGHPGPIAVPRGAAVLLRDRDSGSPVTAIARVGKGRVLVHGDLTVFANHWSSWSAAAYLAFAAPRTRVESDPPPVRDVPRKVHRRGRFTIIDTAGTRRHVPRVLDLARRTLREVVRELKPAKPPKQVEIHLVPGAAASSVYGSGEVMNVRIGADLSDSAVVRALAGMLGGRCLYGWWRLRSAMPLVASALDLLLITVLTRLGFDERAAKRRDAMIGGRRADLGRQYSQSRTGRRSRRLFLDLEDEFGPGVLRKVCGAIPEKEPFKPFPLGTYSGLDVVSYYLARALGPEVYDWLEEQGHTLRRIPLEEPNSDEFKKALDRALAARISDRDLPLSERLSAAEDLATRIRGEQDSLTRIARRARADSPAGLAASFALAVSRDERAGPALRTWLGSEDPGLAAIAALALVREVGEETATDALVAAASIADTRFALAAGRALTVIGDDRAERFSFKSLPGCRIRRREMGPLRLYARIDGRDAAIVAAGPMWHAAGFGSAYSRYYVYWVHTDSRFRRLGLARELLDVSLKSRWAEHCSANALHSMVDYFAHALYREVGMPDSRIYLGFKKQVGASTPEPPAGVRIGPPAPRETLRINRLLNELSAEHDYPDRHLSTWPGTWVARVAREGRKIVGVVAVRSQGDGALVHDLGVADTFKDRKDADDKVVEKGSDRREAVGLALLLTAEKEAHRRGWKKLSAYTWHNYGDGFHQGVLQRAGFKVSPYPLVEQCTIIDLPGHLAEIKPLLEGRLAKLEKLKDWQGEVSLRGERLAASLRIDKGSIEVRRAGSRRPTVTLRGGDDAIERAVLGAASPFEEFVQTRIRVTPGLSPDAQALLEGLFPRAGGPLDRPLP